MVREPSRTATRTILARAKAAGARISLDLNARRHLWPSLDVFQAAVSPLVERADVLKVSEEDLAALGVPSDEDGAHRLHARRHDRVTILTLAERGALGLWGDVMVRVKAPRAKAVDVTGAGDAFTAGALASLIVTGALELAKETREDSLHRAITLGCKLGTRAVTRLGATAALTGLRPLAAPRRKGHR